MMISLRTIVVPALAGALVLCPTLAMAQGAPTAAPGANGTAGVDSTVPAKPVTSAVNINTASTEDLRKLPGITTQRANAIVRARPYTKIDELVSKKVLKTATFDRIKPYIVAN